VSYEYECGLDELIEELLSVKDSLLGMGDRVRAVRQAEGAATAAAAGIGVAVGGGAGEEWNEWADSFEDGQSD